MANINIDQLAAEIAKGLADYSQDAVEKVNFFASLKMSRCVIMLMSSRPGGGGFLLWVTWLPAQAGGCTHRKAGVGRGAKVR
jgi:hypothetical protein